MRISDWSSDVFASVLLESACHQVRVGGDSAMLKGIMKALFEADEADQAAGGIGLLDYTFIAAHTRGIDDLRADITATAWEEIVDRSGLAKTAIESMAQTYWQAERVILCYGMGIDRKSTRLNSSH